ncbi:trifunctional histidinol dehydrogenase [Tulasnella sp. 417]|nr:trifunctional histidinol dehydrogenase [Tulasnella sp. 417]
MALAFIPFVDENTQDDLKSSLGRIGPLLLDAQASSSIGLPPQTDAILLAPSSLTVDEAIKYLDDGAAQLVVQPSLAKELIGTVPPERLLLLLDISAVSSVSDKLRVGTSGVYLKTPGTPEIDLLTSFRKFFPSDKQIYVAPPSDSALPTASLIRELTRASSTLVIPASQLTLSATSQDALNVSEAFLAPLTSDRPDGLFPTIVSSYNHSGKSLGLVYSSAESIKESIVTGKGVYQSRKHGLWRKGETSGAVQEVVSIRVDCDWDTLEFQVVQHGTGFCHLGSTSCFGGVEGLAKLEDTLRSRLQTAPEGSYTKRLFNDPGLLRSKLKEEADELASAQTKEEVAFEAADLLYFALTRCVAAGVSLSDVGASLDKKAKKISRRKGDAKPQYATTSNIPPAKSESAPAQSAPTTALTSGPIQMRTADLTTTSSSERSKLLQRPVLRSAEMIAKVKPIIDQVRSQGDAAIKELTAKFDKAQLQDVVLRAPFPEEQMVLPENVKDAVDRAYKNIYAFHAAQAEKETLVVETMPGVTCSRFARPIARVGLYVPGGTAILPSTALMLGIPAQVAGCREIVLAVPPRSDGSVSPEVLYCAHLVGATTVLKAGGAQAIAAMAYGTESVPKVDKIFGPGNQWVTAAKMAVQNDTDALVSIDMPAGPSEVLVVSDSTGIPSFVAADLLSQAEHGIDSQVVLVTVNVTPEHLAEIEREVDAQANALPRVEIVRQSVAKSLIVKTTSVADALAFSNDYAPEHLILHLENAPDAVKLVENAGSVFVGPWSPESCGDYASGTNHTLPTNGYARQFSGVNTASYQKHITSQQVTQEGLKDLGPIVVTLAECEGLEAHANAVRVRLNHSQA